MKVEIKLNNGKVVIKENNNLVDAIKEFDAKEIESVVYTEGDITTFAKPVKEFRGYTLKVTGKIVQVNLKNKSSFHISIKITLFRDS